MARIVPFALAAAAITLIAVAISPLRLLPAWLLGAGIVTFATYGWDKRQSKRGGWRVPEVVMHGLALGGGVVGAWAGRGVFRHKTRKPEFLVFLIAATAIWVTIVIVEG